MRLQDHLCLHARSVEYIELFIKEMCSSSTNATSFDLGSVHMQHLLKDIKLFNEEARSSMLNTDFLEGLESLISTTVKAGLENSDYSSVYEGVSPPINTIVHPPSSEDAFVVIDPVGPRTAAPAGKH